MMTFSSLTIERLQNLKLFCRKLETYFRIFECYWEINLSVNPHPHYI